MKERENEIVDKFGRKKERERERERGGMLKDDVMVVRARHDH